MPSNSKAPSARPAVAALAALALAPCAVLADTAPKLQAQPRPTASPTPAAQASPAPATSLYACSDYPNSRLSIQLLPGGKALAFSVGSSGDGSLCDLSTDTLNPARLTAPDTYVFADKDTSCKATFKLSAGSVTLTTDGCRDMYCGVRGPGIDGTYLPKK